MACAPALLGAVVAGLGGASRAGAASSYATPYAVSTLAGTANTPGSVNGGSGARFALPNGICMDALGNLYVADTYDNTIRKITPGGQVTTLAGSFSSFQNGGSSNGTGSGASFNSPVGVAVDGSGNIYVADAYNNLIRKVTSAGVVTTVAGQAGVQGSANGTGTAATFNNPTGIAVDGSGYLYVADEQNNTIRKISPAGAVTTLAGVAGVTGSSDGAGSTASFNSPGGIAVDPIGNLFVTDQLNDTIREVTPLGIVTTLAGQVGVTGATDASGTAASFNSPFGIAVDASDNVYVADTTNDLIRKVTSAGVVSTVAGSSNQTGSMDGSSSVARFYNPYGICVTTSGYLYVTDTYNETIRKVTSGGTVSTFVGQVPGGSGVKFSLPNQVAMDSQGNLYVGDSGDNVIDKITPTGTVTTLAGSASTFGNGGSANGTGTAATFNDPVGVGVDSNGNVYVADALNNLIRMITSAGVVTTFAGQTGVSGSANGTGTAAQFSNPTGIAVDSAGNVYVADQHNHEIRKITSGGVVTTVAGAAGTSGSGDGTGTAANFGYPTGVAVDTNGNLFVTDDYYNNVRQVVVSSKVVTTLAGAANTTGGSSDGTGTAASFNSPIGISVDSSDNIYVADSNNDTIRKVTTGGVVSTFVGVAGTSGSTNSASGTPTFYTPYGVVSSPNGSVIYVADTFNDQIRQVTSAGVVTTFAGAVAPSGGPSQDGGSLATFDGPKGIAVDSNGIVYAADTVNDTIREAEGCNVSTLAGQVSTAGHANGNGGAATFDAPASIAVDTNGNAYVADTSNDMIRKIVISSGAVTTLAGQAGTSGHADATGTNATFDLPAGVAVDSGGTVYVADSSNDTVRKVTSGGVVTTLAGQAGTSGHADATGTNATFNNPTGIAADTNGNLYVSDQGNDTIRKIVISSGVVTTFAGQEGTTGSADATGTNATFKSPAGLAVGGNYLYVADSGNDVIRKVVLSSGSVTTLAGTAGSNGSTDGTGSVALFKTPTGVAVDSNGAIYVADSLNDTLRLGVEALPVVSPAGDSVVLGTSLSFSVSYAGTATSYAWLYNGTAVANGGDITGATSSTLAFSGAQYADAGSYVAVVTNAGGTVESPAAILAVTSPAPIFVIQPVSLAVAVGGNAQFSAAAQGTPNPTYQWFYNGSSISGATSSVYSIPFVLPNSAGSYYAQASNSAGSTNSDAATLTSNATPTITTQPTASTEVAPGASATFSVVAVGIPSPDYQWYFDGTASTDAIPGAVDSTYTINSVTTANAGTYAVLVGNSAGSVFSSAAALLVDSTPTIATQPASVSVTAGSPVTLSVGASGTPLPAYQWNLGGSTIAGATSSTYSIASATATQAGSYTVTVSNASGSIVSNAAIVTVTSAPVITTQPSSETVVNGGVASFSVVAAATPAPTYQWLLNNSDVSGATAATYTIPVVALSSAGTYTVVVSNSLGSVVSSGATLSVGFAPNIGTEPVSSQTVVAGSSASFTVVVTGNPVPTYQWYFGSTLISGASSSTYTIGSVASGNAGTYSVVASNSLGSTTSTGSSLAVNVAPAFTSPAVSQTVVAGSTATFAVTVSGNPAPTYQWNFDGTAIGGATSTSLSIADVGVVNDGTYSVVATNTLSSTQTGTATSSATLTVTIAPTIPTQPVSETVTAGQPASFSTVAAGTPAPTYQWFFNGTPIAGAVSSTYGIAVTVAANAGSYAVAASNSAGAITSSAATLTVNAAPVFVTQPSSVSVLVGASATFTAVATATPAPAYTWAFNGTVIGGATSSTYTIPVTASGNAGSYTAIATNSVGSTVSTAATLAFNVPVAFTSQPQSQTVLAGNPVTFTAAATGTPAPTYQWGLGVNAIAGATSSSYTIAAVASGNAGSYSVTVTNSVNSLTSSSAVLTVDVAPRIVTQPASTTVNAGSAASFSVVAAGNPAPTYQWSHNGTAISGATSSTYAIASVTTANAGSYAVTVSNTILSTVESVTSLSATLTVDVAPAITAQPGPVEVVQGGNATFTAGASGNPAPAFQWSYNGSAIAGASSLVYTITGVTPANAGTYTVTASNSLGSVTSSGAALAVDFPPSVTTPPAPQTAVAGTAATFTVVVAGYPTPAYQWSFNGTPIGGATSSSYTVATVTPANAGSYAVSASNSQGSTSSSSAVLTVDTSPVFTTQPAAQTATAGATATFTAAAGGNPAPGYQWSVGGTAIAGATSSTYTTGATVAAMNGTSYTVTASNGIGSAVTSAAAVLTVDYAPAITTQPSGQSVNSGSIATFTAAASGNPAPTFQWSVGGTAISGATSSTQSVVASAALNGASYTVTASNGIGTAATSAAAILNVNFAPAITTSPTAQTVAVGGTATFTAAASGNPAPMFQWSVGGTAIAGATSSSYTTPVATSGMNGTSYTVAASNGIGTAATSAAAILTIDYGPVITSQPFTPQTANSGSSVTFTVAATGNPSPTYQWTFNGSTLTGAVSSTYFIASVSAAQAGTYAAIATNVAGSAVSQSAVLTVDFKPSITSQPTASQTVNAGGPASFTVAASGVPAPTFQWLFNNSAISGATSSTLALASVTPASAGSYAAVATNSLGSAKSSAAVLIVDFTPVITVQPTAQTVLSGTSVTFTGGASSVPAPSYQWTFNGSAIFGATSSTLALGAVQPGYAGTYAFVASNSVGSAVSGGSALVVNYAPTITTQPSSETVVTGNTATFSAAATGFPAPTFQWSFNGSALTDGTQGDGSIVTGSATPSLAIANAQTPEAGVYTLAAANSIATATSSAATLTINVAPAITSQPAGSTILVGASATFTVAATGNPSPAYQWSFNGTALTDGTQSDGSVITGSATATLIVGNAQPGESGSYLAVATNVVASATSSAAVLTVQAVPLIVTGPAAQTVLVGGGVAFTAAASGIPAPTYQWAFNASAIAGATSSTYSISGATTANAGTYTVTATNVTGSAVSGGALLTVQAVPVITSQPASQTATVPAGVTFTTAATGIPAPTFQWTYDGTPIAGATLSAYAIPVTALANAGTYAVVASNAAGSAVSNGATLTMQSVPQVTTQPAAVTVTVPAAATFSVAVSGTPAPAYQWSANGTVIPGATSSAYTTPATTAAMNESTYTVTATNAAGSVASNGALLTVDYAVAITTQPAPQTVIAPAPATFTVAVTGNPAPAYQWSLNGTAIAGATSASYTTPATAAAMNGGAYGVTVSNGIGNPVASSPVVLTVDSAVAITVQPTAQTVSAPSPVTFAAAATGNPAPTYQWTLNGTAIAGATSTSYSIVATTAAMNGGVYGVTVSNGIGSAVASTPALLTVNFGAAITTQPVSQTVTAPAAATFTVVATGNPAPTFQWALNGSAIAGATSASYVTPATTPGMNGGGYTVTVTNSLGSAATNPAAILTVDFAPVIGTAPVSQTVNAGAAATFTAAASGNPAAAYQWSLNGTAIAGATSASYTTAPATAAMNGGTYTVTATNGIGTAASATAVLTVDFVPPVPVISPAASVTVTVPAAATFTVVATGNPAPTFQWALNGSAIAGATSASYTTPATNPAMNGGSYTVTASNGLGSATSLATVLTVDFAPAITTAPAPQTVTAGATATFTAAASGNPAAAYQWSVNGTAIAGATSASYTTPATTAAMNGGSYTVTASNGIGSAVTSGSAVLTVNFGVGITTQPVSQTVTTPAAVTFTVVATGNPAPTYQWSVNGTAIAGATSASYTTPATTAAMNGGAYTVTVSDGIGSAVTSSIATLTVDFGVSVTTAPASQTVTAPAAATFTVVVAGNPAPAYQWSVNGTAIAGATSASYTTPATTAAMNGSAYTVTVSDGIGSAVTSGPATLTVDFVPVITTQPISQSVVLAGSVTFTVVAGGNPAPAYQWFFAGSALANGTQADGSVLSGSTSASLTLSNLMETDDGSYTVRVSNSAGSVVSSPASLTVTLPQGAFFGTFGGGTFALYILPNGTGVLLGYDPTSGIVLSETSFPVGSNGQFSFTTTSGGSTAAGSPAPDIASGTLTVSGTLTGSGVTITVTGSGTNESLAGTFQPATGSTASLAGYYLDSQVDGSGVLQVIVGGNGTAYTLLQTSAGTSGGTGSISNLGALSVTTNTSSTVTGTVSSQGTVTAALTPAGTGSSSSSFDGGTQTVSSAATVVNSLALASSSITSGNNVAIEGFVLAGTARPVLVQGLGPLLAQLPGLDVPGPYLATPSLSLYGAGGGAGAPLASNTGWTTAPNDSAIIAAETSSGATPLLTTSADSAILTSLSAGAYTAVESGANGATGTAVLEVYDTGTPPSQMLLNTSTRGPVAAAGSLTHGFSVGGTVPVRVLIRAVGPGLSTYGVSNPLALTKLTLFSGATQIETNTGWSTSPDAAGIATAATSAGAFSLTSGSGDSAILVALNPGTYQAVATGATGGSGTVLIEVYWLP